MLHTTEGVLKPHKEGEAQVTSTSHPPLGILMLETEFERVVGDGGNPATWAFPTRLETISAATPDAVVHRGAHALVDEFVAAGRRLANAGVVGITTSCGFLILHQRALADGIGIPVATSALLQVPTVQALLPEGRCVGIMTASERSLTRAHLQAAGIEGKTPVVGLDENGHLSRVLLTGEEQLDVALAEQDVLSCGRQLLDTYPDIAAIVLECTNLPPYAARLSATLNCPVYDFYSMVNWFYQGLVPHGFTSAT